MDVQKIYKYKKKLFDTIREDTEKFSATDKNPYESISRGIIIKDFLKVNFYSLVGQKTQPLLL